MTDNLSAGRGFLYVRALVRIEHYFRKNGRRENDFRENDPSGRKETTFRRFLLWDSKSDFLFVIHPLVKAQKLYEGLRSVGISVRYFSNPERISDYLRIAIGTDQETDSLIMQLKKRLKQ